MNSSQEIRADGWQHDVAGLRRQVAEQQHQIGRLRQQVAEAAAAERERIRLLAIEHGATYDDRKPCGCGRNRPDGSACMVLLQSGLPFADLLDTP